MATFRAVSQVEIDGRNVRASATLTVTVSVDAAPRRRPAAARHRVPMGLRDPNVRWDVLPERIRPEDWITGQATAEVPGALLAGERERRPEGFCPGAAGG